MNSSVSLDKIKLENVEKITYKPNDSILNLQYYPCMQIVIQYTVEVKSLYTTVFQNLENANIFENEGSFFGSK